MNALTRSEAAALCRLTPSGFDGWVRRGIVPPPIPRTKRWSRVQLERALAGLPWVPVEGGERPEDAYDAWSREHAERERFKPHFDLNERERSTLRKLCSRGSSNGRDIAGAAERTFAALARHRLAESSGGLWQPTEEGLAEAARIDAWSNWHKR